MSEQQNTRWWENYVVRYFVGTVFGAGIVVFLNEYQGPVKGLLSKVAGVQELTFKEITVFASIGFAYCYVASSPILTIHALREHIRITRLREQVWRWPVVLLVGGAVVWATANYGLAASPIVNYLVATTLVVILGLQLVLVLTAMLNRFTAVRAFYVGLSAARAHESKCAAEYVESYRHLREHGNAFSILLLEALLGFVVANLPNTNAVILVAALWILPASFSWLVGTALESKFAYEAPPSQKRGG